MDNLQLWGGVECTVNRVGDDFFHQLDRNGHAGRDGDIERFASLGIRALRYPVLWERTAPELDGPCDWRWTDQRLNDLRRWGIEPIAGLLHHGSGPRHTHLLDRDFATQLASYAGEVARRYPWLRRYTPVNEPLTTARFSALYGVWYPHARDDRSFVRALLNETLATVLSMHEIRRVNPAAQLVQTEDLGKSHGTPALQHVVDFYNERRWLSWDLLCGRVGPDHALWPYLLEHGAHPDELHWLQDHPCPPDLLGINYYVTGERWLDHRLERCPERFHGAAFGHPLADMEAARAPDAPPIGVAPLLREAWDRYRLPMAVTEAHIDAHREDQLRWLHEIWHAAEVVRGEGVQVEAVTVWALLGSFDWNCLVTRCQGYYEPGPFDLRADEPRPTALASMMRELAAGVRPSHPVLPAPGWWRRPGRFLVPGDVEEPTVVDLEGHRAARADAGSPPLLVVGEGPLAQQWRARCRQRHVPVLAADWASLELHSALRHPLQDEPPGAGHAAGGDTGADAAQRHARKPWGVILVSPPDEHAVHRAIQLCHALNLPLTCVVDGDGDGDGDVDIDTGFAGLALPPRSLWLRLQASEVDGEATLPLDPALDLVIDREAGVLEVAADGRVSVLRRADIDEAANEPDAATGEHAVRVPADGPRCDDEGPREDDAREAVQ